ncbi:MAG: Spy/CpxP family protein refolding chaperone [Pyrinomonadaceae bacterium]
MKVTIIIAVLFVSFLLLVGAVVGQQGVPPAQAPQPGMPQGQGPRHPPNMQNAPNMPQPPPNPNLLADVMFPPDMVLGHARELRLTDDQKAFMRGEVQKTMTVFTDLQWKLQDQMDALHEVLKANSVSEDQALAQLNKVLDIEREIKRLHIGMAVRIKNHLTAEQQEQLHRMQMGPMGMPPGPPPPDQE